jgi:hypothetical protein
MITIHSGLDSVLLEEQAAFVNWLVGANDVLALHYDVIIVR